MPPAQGKPSNGNGAPALGRDAATLRIVNITDVYMLDNFPSLKTLLAQKKAENKNGPTISMLTGDFLAPYLLSSVDFGRGMMHMLNNTPIDYVIWGNHEHDLPHRHVCERIQEYKGTWINTNMQNHEMMHLQKDRAVVEVASPDGSNRRKVGLLSMLTDQESLYRPGKFGGATIDDPWTTAKQYKTILEEKEGVDLVVPLCHLYEPQDEKTCEMFDFPLVISGHDHHVVDRVISGSRLVKAGSDGHKAAIIDITWPSPTSAKRTPTINVEFLTVKDFAPDAELNAAAEKSMSVLDSLRKTQLTAIPKQLTPLSSAGSRDKLTTAGIFLCDSYKDAFNQDVSTPTADAVLLPGGNVRGGRTYKPNEFFSLESLKSEIHPKMDICVVKLPGSVVSEIVRETHTMGSHPYLMQFDSGVAMDPATKKVTKIAGLPIVPNKIYNVGYPFEELKASNGPKCLQIYLNEDPEGRMPNRDATRGGQEFLLQHWAHCVWEAVWNRLDANHDGVIDKGEFEQLDRDRSGAVDRGEVLEFMGRELGLDVASDETTFAEHVLRVGGDSNSDGLLTWEEFCAAQPSATAKNGEEQPQKRKRSEGTA